MPKKICNILYNGICHKTAVDIAGRFNASYVNMHRDVARVVAGDTVLDFSNFKGADIHEDLMRTR